MYLIETTSQNKWVTVATTLALIAGTISGIQQASAQDDAKENKKHVEIEKEGLRGDFDKPLGEDDQDVQVGGNVSMMMSESDNGREYQVQINNGKTTVQRDGKKLSKDQYRIKGGKIEFLDGDGNVEHTMQMPSMQKGQPNSWFNIRPRAIAPRAPIAPVAPAQPAPPVMLGITMSDHEDGALIDTVRKDLPAAKAGLKEGDVIVKIGDKKVRDQSDVRSILRDHKPGQKLDVVILRDGDKKTLGVDLEAWDAKALGIEEAPEAAEVPGQVWGLPGGNNEEWWRNFTQNFGGESKEALTEARKALEEALDEVDGAKDDIEELRKTAKDALQTAIDALKDAEKNASGSMRIFTPGQNGDGQQFVLPQLQLRRERENQARDQEKAFRDQSDEMRKQLDEIREQMREMRKQLEENSKKKNDR